MVYYINILHMRKSTRIKGEITNVRALNKILFTSIITASAFLLMAAMPACSGKPKGEPIAPKDGVFSIDAKSIGAGDVRFFSYSSGGKDIVFFVARSDTGVIKAAFDACVTCYPNKKGYRQEGDSVVCIFCGNRFRLEELNKGIGNCIPIALNFRLTGDTVLIDQTEVMAGSSWF